MAAALVGLGVGLAADSEAPTAATARVALPAAESATPARKDLPGTPPLRLGDTPAPPPTPPRAAAAPQPVTPEAAPRPPASAPVPPPAPAPDDVQADDGVIITSPSQ